MAAFVIVFLSYILTPLKFYLLNCTGFVASTKYHKQMIKAVAHSPSLFFD